MTDDQIETLVMDEIKKRGVTVYDMIGLSKSNIDPNPEDKSKPSNQRARGNKFDGLTESDRMEELLCVGDYNPYKSFQPLKVSFQDLFRFWWNRCIVQELFVDEILGEIFTYFTDQMRPPEKEENHFDITIDFEQLSLFSTELCMAV
jgi:hypothetical protein